MPASLFLSSYAAFAHGMLYSSAGVIEPHTRLSTRTRTCKFHIEAGWEGMDSSSKCRTRRMPNPRRSRNRIRLF